MNVPLDSTSLLTTYCVSSSRFRFMVETLVNLKNNKLKDSKRSTGTGQNVASEAIERMKKYLSGISKKRHGKPRYTVTLCYSLMCCWNQ